MRLCVIIPAAGRSERFGDRDKLTQDLGGRPMLVRTVERFARRDEVASILVAGPPPEVDGAAVFRERFAPTLSFHGARIVDGGVNARSETVRRALAEVPDDATHVAVHDAARPAVDDGLLDRVLAAAAVHDAVVPGLPVADTLKRADATEARLDDGDDADRIADALLGDAGRSVVTVRRVLETVDRAHLWAVQTPQVFAVDVLRRAYEDPSAVATDDAALVEALGVPVHLVRGSSTNLKVTTPEDLVLVAAIMAAESGPTTSDAAADLFG